MQDNLISQVTGLAALAGLQKLYLQGNHIRRLSGLGGLINLEEVRALAMWAFLACFGCDAS